MNTLTQFLLPCFIGDYIIIMTGLVVIHHMSGKLLKLLNDSNPVECLTKCLSFLYQALKTKIRVLDHSFPQLNLLLHGTQENY